MYQHANNLIMTTRGLAFRTFLMH